MKKKAIVLFCVLVIMLSAVCLAACNDNTKEEFDYASDPIIGTYTMEYEKFYNPEKPAKTILLYITITSCKAENPDYQYPTHFRCQIKKAELYTIGGDIFESEERLEIDYIEYERKIYYSRENKTYAVFNYETLIIDNGFYGRWDDGVFSSDKNTLTFTEYNNVVGGQKVKTWTLSRTDLTETGFEDYCEERFGIK